MVLVRKSFIVSFFAVLIFAFGYLYYIAQAVCPTPITYKLGSIDPRFNLSAEQAKLVISDAASVWEDATGRNLFTYSETGKLPINFVYDERQQFVTAEESLKGNLDKTQDLTTQLNSTYTELVAKYNTLKESYTQQANAYEVELRAYNAEVAKYNAQGGAPAGVYASLQKQKAALDTKQQSLNKLSASLNALVTQINTVGQKGNALIDTYNKGVGVYNKTFGQKREFTQGDYNGSSIQIYTYKDIDELKLVLTHELGHALSLDHVEGSTSVMYYLIGEQPKKVTLMKPDIDEFSHVCGSLSLWEQLQVAIKKLYALQHPS